MVTPRVTIGTRQVRKWFPSEDTALGRTEAAALSALAGTGRAPRLLRVDSDRDGSTLLLSKVEGAPLTTVNPDVLRALAQSLAAVHSVSTTGLESTVQRVPCSAVLLGKRLGRLLSELQEHRVFDRRALSAWAAALARSVMPHLRGLEPVFNQARPALCHGDLKPDNVLVHRGQVVLVDFEQARLADPACDLARAAVVLGLSGDEEDTLLHAWATPGDDAAPLAIRFHGYRLLALAWFPLARALAEHRGERRPDSALSATLDLSLERAQTALSLLHGRPVPAPGRRRALTRPRRA